MKEKKGRKRERNLNWCEETLEDYKKANTKTEVAKAKGENIYKKLYNS